MWLENGIYRWSWDENSRYMESHKAMFQTTNQINNGSPNPIKSPLKLHYSHKITIKTPLFP
jgi:hypothetical protein